jgi:membrane protein
MRAHGALDAARLMAFNFFLSVVPLLVLLGFVLGRFVRRRGVDAIVGPLLETIPDASAELVRHELERLAGSSAASIAPLGAMTFLWLTSSGIHQMMDVFEVASRAPRRSWLKQRIMALATVAIGVSSLSFTAWALVNGDDFVHRQEAQDFQPATPPAVSSTASQPTASPGSVRSSSPPSHGARDPKPAGHAKKRQLLTRVHAGWERLVAGGVVLLVGLVGLAGFYRVAVEHPAGIRRRAWPGALAAMSAWFVVSWVFGSYIGSIGAYAVYYGSLAAVAVLLVWLYLTGLALLFGAEVNAMLEGVGAHE